jgi:hypothetical protein
LGEAETAAVGDVKADKVDAAGSWDAEGKWVGCVACAVGCPVAEGGETNIEGTAGGAELGCCSVGFANEAVENRGAPAGGTDPN